MCCKTRFVPALRVFVTSSKDLISVTSTRHGTSVNPHFLLCSNLPILSCLDLCCSCCGVLRVLCCAVLLYFVLCTLLPCVVLYVKVHCGMVLQYLCSESCMHTDRELQVRQLICFTSASDSILTLSQLLQCSSKSSLPLHLHKVLYTHF